MVRADAVTGFKLPDPIRHRDADQELLLPCNNIAVTSIIWIIPGRG